MTLGSLFDGAGTCPLAGMITGFSPVWASEIEPFGFDDIERFEKQTCLTSSDIVRYLDGFYGYGWHISDLKIYDKPRELSEFFTPMGKRPSYMLERPPQSWCYVEELATNLQLTCN